MKIGTLDISNLCVGGSQASAAYLGSTQVWSPAPPPTPGYIFYESTDNNIVVPNVLSGFGANIVSNEYIGGGTCKITFDGAVTAIPNSAFSGCTRLSDIELPDTVVTIGQQAFGHCSGLTAMAITTGVTQIGDSAFSNCKNLIELKYNGTKTDWGNVSKGSNWNSNVPSYGAYCSNGYDPWVTLSSTTIPPFKPSSFLALSK